MPPSDAGRPGCGVGESKDSLDARPLVLEELANPPGRDAVGLVDAHEGDGEPDFVNLT